MCNSLLGILFIVAAGLSGSPVRAQATDGTAAFLFAYHVKDGMLRQFEEGYRRHLDWHRQVQDPLPWFAWYVTTGERYGLFIDGTFGISFQAFDKRIQPGADFANLMETTLPFVTPAFSRAYRLRPELGTGHPIEDRTPTRSVHVIHFAVNPGMESRFEEWAARVREAARTDGAPVLTWYELVAGGEHPGYMLHVSRSGWRDIGAAPGVVATILGDGAAGGTDDLTTDLAGLVREITSEVWSYRENLSLFER